MKNKSASINAICYWGWNFVTMTMRLLDYSLSTEQQKWFYRLPSSRPWRHFLELHIEVNSLQTNIRNNETTITSIKKTQLINFICKLVLALYYNCNTTGVIIVKSAGMLKIHRSFVYDYSCKWNHVATGIRQRSGHFQSDPSSRSSSKKMNTIKSSPSTLKDSPLDFPENP